MKLHAVVDDLETARVAVAGGATVVQLRLKDASTREVVEQGIPFRELPATFIVNDDVQAAIALAADGVHLGQSDSGLGLALVAGLMIGLSASTVEEATQAEKQGAAYIGAGLSPGDGHYDEPYFYLSLYPAPEPSTLPPLPPLGHWRVEDFTGAVATATAIRATARPEADTNAFLAAALAAALALCR